MWEKIFDARSKYFREALDLIQTSDKGFVVLYEENNIRGLLKIDETGNILWEKVFEEWSCRGEKLLNLEHNEFIVLGTGGYNNNYSICVEKIDSDKNILPLSTFGKNKVPYTIIKGNDGNFIIAGTFRRDLYLVKIDKSGKVLWEKIYGGHLIERPSRVDLRVAGIGYTVIGSKDNGYTPSPYCRNPDFPPKKMFLLGINEDGEINFATKTELKKIYLKDWALYTRASSRCREEYAD